MSNNAPNITSAEVTSVSEDTEHTAIFIIIKHAHALARPLKISTVGADE